VQILDRQPDRPISIIWIAAGARRVAHQPPCSCNSGKIYFYAYICAYICIPLRCNSSFTRCLCVLSGTWWGNKHANSCEKRSSAIGKHHRPSQTFKVGP